MAKLKVKQIEDLLLTPDTPGAVRSIQIGANVIKPLTGVSATESENSVAGGYISGLSVSGNEIVITRTALPEITFTGNGENDGDFVLNAAVNATEKHQIDLTRGKFDVSTNAEGETPYTGSLIFGADNVLKVNDTWVKSFIGDGILKVKFGTAEATDLFTANAATGTIATLELSAVAKEGKAELVSIADADSVITATTVEGALVEIAKEIDAMDLTATDVVALTADKTALQAGKISETDGKVSVEDAATLVEFSQPISSDNKVATMADVKTVADAAKLVGEKAIEVNPATGENATGNVVSLKIKSDDKILDQTVANGLFSTLSLTYDAAAQADGKKYIRLKGKNDIDISTIDATEFIKDGMLSNAKLVTTPETGVTETAPYIKLTFNTDAGQEVIRFSVKSLVDVYTAKANDWIELNDHEFSHKTQGLFTPVEGQTAPKTAFGGDVAENALVDVTIEGAGQSAKFTVPSFVVDAAGHVTSAEDKVVEVKLPAAQTITGEIATSQGSYINVKVTATKGQDNDNYTLSTTSNVTTQAVATAAAANGETPAIDGLATALDVKNYVADQLAGQSPATITMTQIVRGTNANANEDFVTLAVPAGYSIVQAGTVGFLNGQLVPTASLSFEGNKVTYVAYTDGSAVNFEEGDRFDVVATATKDVQVIGYTAPAE